MGESNRWKVVRRTRAAESPSGVSVNAVRTYYTGESVLIAGPFDSMKDAQHWIDIHPEMGMGLVAAPIVLPPRSGKYAD
jgi:hypothetical protein